MTVSRLGNTTFRSRTALKISRHWTPKTYAAVRELGSHNHLRRAIPAIPDTDVAIVVVTSVSFLYCVDGVQHQLRTLRELTGPPCTSTSASTMPSGTWA